MLNAGGGVEASALGRGFARAPQARARVRTPGTFGAYCSEAPRLVRVGGAVVPFEYDGVVQSSVRPPARVSTDYLGPAVGPYVEVDDENVEAIMAEWEVKGGAKAESRPARMNWADEM